MAQKPTPPPAAASSAALVDEPATGEITVETTAQAAERERQEALRQNASASLVAPLYFPDAALEDLGDFEQPETFGDQVAAVAPTALEQFEANQARGVGEKQEQFDGIPQRQRDAFDADRARNLGRIAADTGIDVASVGFVTATRQQLAAETKHVVYLFPFNIEWPEEPREFSINMVPFVLETGVPKRVPKSVVAFCVERGWCQCPKELVAEFEEKNIRPPRQQRIIAPSRLAVISQMQANGLDITGRTGFMDAAAAMNTGGW